jgi:hypothetical protein
MRNAHKILVENPDGKRPLWVYSHTWEYNTETDFKGVVWETVDWIQLAQEESTWEIYASMEHNIKTDVLEMAWVGVDWIQPTRDRVQ